MDDITRGSYHTTPNLVLLDSPAATSASWTLASSRTTPQTSSMTTSQPTSKICSRSGTNLNRLLGRRNRVEGHYHQHQHELKGHRLRHERQRVRLRHRCWVPHFYELSQDQNLWDDGKLLCACDVGTNVYTPITIKWSITRQLLVNYSLISYFQHYTSKSVKYTSITHV